MGTKASLTLGALAILALLIAGVSYWTIRENPHSASGAKNLAEAPPPAVQVRPENSLPIDKEKQAADASIQTRPPSTAPAAPSPASSAPPTTAGQSKDVPTPPSSPSISAAPEQSREVTEKPPSAAMPLAMPDEDKMSEANRRQVQEALHGLGYYSGPVDGIFGPLTRASIRQFQDSIGEKETGLLTAAEAGRLVSGTGLGTGASTQRHGELQIPESAVGHRQPKPAELPPLQEKQGNVPAPDNFPAAQNNARARGGSKQDSGTTGNAGDTYGRIPSICTGC